MKISIVVALVITVFISIAAMGAGQKSRKPTNWQPVIGATFPNTKTFIDANKSETTITPDGGKMNYVEILLSYDTPQTTLVGKQNITFRAMVRHLVMDCSSGLSAPIYDFYFAEPMPSRSNKPLGALDYDAPIKDIATTVSKSSAIYHAVCPEFI